MSTDAWITSLDHEQHKAATRHLRDLIELEVMFPMNMLATLRQISPADLAVVARVFEQAQAARMALAARREGRPL